MSTPAIARQSHALPPICHDSALGKVRIAETRQKPANRPETGKANRGWLTAERAKALGKIGADKFAASKRGKSILPMRGEWPNRGGGVRSLQPSTL